VSDSQKSTVGDSQRPLVDLQCGRHTYPDGTVGIHDVAFSVSPDEVVALVGGNGAGKSTLLEHLNATLVPDEGELVVDGTEITGDNESLARRAGADEVIVPEVASAEQVTASS
jgi:cobalt/nickel transport system ATP-binding protein